MAEAIEAKLRERDEMFEAACDAVAGDIDLDLDRLAEEMDGLNDDPMEESLNASEAR